MQNCVCNIQCTVVDSVFRFAFVLTKKKFCFFYFSPNSDIIRLCFVNFIQINKYVWLCWIFMLQVHTSIGCGTSFEFKSNSFRLYYFILFLAPANKTKKTHRNIGKWALKTFARFSLLNKLHINKRKSIVFTFEHTLPANFHEFSVNHFEHSVVSGLGIYIQAYLTSIFFSLFFFHFKFSFVQHFCSHNYFDARNIRIDVKKKIFFFWYVVNWMERKRKQSCRIWMGKSI